MADDKVYYSQNPAPEEFPEIEIVSTNIADYKPAAKVEEEMLAEAAQANIPQAASIEEAASVLFGLYLPRFTDIVRRLSSKSLKRLIYSIVAVPLEDAVVNLKNEDERTAYAICEQLMVSKSALIMNAVANEEKNKQKYKEHLQNEEQKTDDKKE